MSNVTALILLAGIGKRMKTLGKQTPKSLLVVKNKPILWYSINTLQKCGISKFIFVTGYKADKIISFSKKMFPKLSIKFIYNNKFNTTNSIYSYFLAREHVKNKDFLRTILQLCSVQMAFTALTSLAPIFVVDVLNRDKGYIAFIMGPVILVALASFALLPKLYRKFTSNFILLCSICLIGLLFILVLPISVVSQGSPTYYILLFGLLGMPMASVLGLEALAVTDVMNEDEEAGIYFGAFNFIIKAMNGFAIMIAGYAIDLSSTYQNPAIILWTLTAFGLLVMLMVSISMKIGTSKDTQANFLEI